MPRVAPSVLAADFAHLPEEIRSAEEAGVELLHLDIMDGHFVPNISFGPGMVRTIDGLTDLFLDVHLMLAEPEKYFQAFVDAGADAITFHLEVHPEPDDYAKQLRSLGVAPGISLNPDTPVERVLSHLQSFDYLLVMSVFPGFGGQEFIESSVDRIRQARKYIDQHSLSTRIIVDGGVDEKKAQTVIGAGAEILVMGTAFFRSSDRRKLVARVQEALSSRPARREGERQAE